MQLVVSVTQVRGYFRDLVKGCKLGRRCLEDALDISHFHNHSLELGEVLECHLAVLSAKAW